MPSLPLFPLGTVLLPGARLPLVLFEPRYLELARRLAELAEDDRCFGVVLIRKGHEVGAGAVQDLLGGQIQMQIDQTTLPHILAGRLRGLAIINDARWPYKPDIPTLREGGYGKDGGESWYGLLAPAGTPEPILAKLEAAITEALKTPDIQKRWANDLGLDLPPPGRKGFDQFVAEDRKLWAPAVKASGVKLD